MSSYIIDVGDLSFTNEVFGFNDSEACRGHMALTLSVDCWAESSVYFVFGIIRQLM